jgi:hypothetical protein
MNAKSITSYKNNNKSIELIPYGIVTYSGDAAATVTGFITATQYTTDNSVEGIGIYTADNTLELGKASRNLNSILNTAISIFYPENSNDSLIKIFGKIDSDLRFTKQSNGWSTIRFDAQANDPAYIGHWENNNQSQLRFSVSDDFGQQDCFTFGADTGNGWQVGTTIWTDGTINTNGTIFCGGEIQAANGFVKVGKKYTSSWTGTVYNGGSNVVINHNLGYVPIISLGGNVGNINLSYSVNTTTLTLCVYNSGGNNWTGTVYLW